MAPKRLLVRAGILGVLTTAALTGTVLTPTVAVADDGAVIQGTWTVTITVAKHLPDFGTVSGTVTFRFGEGCTVGQPCSLTTQAEGEDKPTKSDFDGSPDGFTRTNDAALDCFDDVTGELRTKHGADYHSVSHYRVSATEVRDGVTYATAMTGTYLEKVVITSAGRADECHTSSGGFSATQRAVLTATAAPLPAPTPGTSTDPVGVDPAAVAASGTIAPFALPLSDTAADSVRAVEAGRRSSVPGALTVPSDALES